MDELEKRDKNTPLVVIGLGVLSGIVLGFLFILITTFFGRSGDSDDHFGVFAPFGSLVLGSIYGAPIGGLVTPVLYFRFLRNVEIDTRLVGTVFLYTFVSGLVGFLLFFPAGVLTACVGFRLACDVLKDDAKTKGN